MSVDRWQWFSSTTTASAFASASASASGGDGGRDGASRTQYPLILAWALTIHKSQALTIDRAVIDLAEVFGCGMTYVAMSRVRSLAHVRVLGFAPHAVIASPKAVQWYHNLDPLSATTTTASATATTITTPTQPHTTPAPGPAPAPASAATAAYPLPNAVPIAGTATAAAAAAARRPSQWQSSATGPLSASHWPLSSVSQVSQFSPLSQPLGTRTHTRAHTGSQLHPPHPAHPAHHVPSKRDDPSKAATIGNGVTVAQSWIVGAGKGLFASVPFLPNDYITEYGGEVIDKAEAERRRAAGHATHIRGLAFGHVALDGRHVTGVAGDGGASFANDPFSLGGSGGSGGSGSSGSIDSRDSIGGNGKKKQDRVNSKFVIVTSFDVSVGVQRSGLVVGERVFLRATKAIPAGDEIYVDYGNDYWHSPDHRHGH